MQCPCKWPLLSKQHKSVSTCLMSRDTTSALERQSVKRDKGESRSTEQESPPGMT